MFKSGAPDTIAQHLDLIAREGSVFWPKVSKSGRLGMTPQDVTMINGQMGLQRRRKAGETHLYMYAPEHLDSPPQLHVGRLTRIFFEHEIKRNDSRIPGLYKSGDIEDPIPYFFQLTEIMQVNREQELTNLLVYPGIVFLDLVSLVSPQLIVEAKGRRFFGAVAVG
jgi:hypothetical protein